MLSSHRVPSLSPSLALSDWSLLSVRSVPSLLRSPFHNPTFPHSNDKPLALLTLFTLLQKSCKVKSFVFNLFRTLQKNVLRLLFRFTQQRSHLLSLHVFTSRFSGYPRGTPRRENLSRGGGDHPILLLSPLLNAHHRLLTPHPETSSRASRQTTQRARVPWRCLKWPEL